MEVLTTWREVLIKLPPDLPNERYAALTHAFFSVVHAAGLANRSSIAIDAAATDADLNADFDRHGSEYPWGN